MAGLSFITSHTKAYAQASNCGSSGSGVVKTISGGEPIVCSSGDGTRTLNSSGGDINIDMDGGSGEAAGAAVTVTGAGTNITIIKKITVTGSRGSGKPVIKVLSGGALTLDQEVNVTGVGIQKVIVVEGQGSSVTLNGVLTGFEGMEVKSGGAIVFEKGVTGIEKVKVGINNGGMVRFDKSVTFNNDEAGIKITGSGAGKASVMGMGKTVTMTVKGNGGGIEMQGSGKADVMMLKIKNSGGGGSGAGNYGVQGSGAVILTSVGIEGFKKGVDATNGTLNINMGSITFESGNGNYGVQVQNGVVANLTSVTIKGTGSGQGTGVIMGSSKTLKMTEVGISKVKVGVDVQSGAVADLTKVTIMGSGQGTGLYVVGGTATMNGGEIKEVESGVYATGAGKLTINGGAKIQFNNGDKNYGVKVENGVVANLMNVKIMGSGSGQGEGKGVIKDGTGTM
ncbi:hypothetical protein, partial [Bartonella bovis]|uniref:hypothetical protein n=1 Tax=Bartonella bovis TaxID=155194 RepID=UPI0011AF8555